MKDPATISDNNSQGIEINFVESEENEGQASSSSVLSAVPPLSPVAKRGLPPGPAGQLCLHMRHCRDMCLLLEVG